NNATSRVGKLCAADLNDGVVVAGAPGIECAVGARHASPLRVSLDRERDRHGFRIRILVNGVEIIDFERTSHLVTGKVLENVERQKLIRPRPPWLTRREYPPHLPGVNSDVSLN